MQNIKWRYHNISNCNQLLCFSCYLLVLYFFTKIIYKWFSNNLYYRYPQVCIPVARPTFHENTVSSRPQVTVITTGNEDR